ncbi:MAG: ribosomal protein L7/L12 [Planctomycetaceae bacterium]|nr:ribosomal protein L7/L12 [Planctomycetaceae bacterium]
MRRPLLLALVAMGVLAGSLTAQEAQPAKSEPSKEIDQLQNGEPIAAIDKALVDAPLRRAPDYPWIKLSELRLLKIAKTGPELQVDYEVTEGSPSEVVLVFKSVMGRKTRRWSLDGEKAATIRFAEIWNPAPADVEAWVEFGGGLLTPTDAVVGYKISNSVTIGDKGQITPARHWKPEEEKRYADLVRAKSQANVPAKPPSKAPPAGYAVAGDRTLLPGMPVLVFAEGDWRKGEYLGTHRHFLVAKRDGQPVAMLHAAVTQRDYVAVAERVLEQAKTKPDSFSPSVRMLPESLLPLNDNFVPLPADVRLLPGVPLQYGFGSRWTNVSVFSAPVDGQVETIEDSSFRQYKYPFSNLAINKSVLEELAKPDAAEVFAKRYEELTVKWAAGRRQRALVRDHLATFPLPDGHEPLGEKVAVKKGDRFQIYSSKWTGAVAVADSPEGAVEIQWDGRNANWNEFVSRKSLFIKPPRDKPAAADAAVPTKKPGGGYSLMLEVTGTKKFAVVKVVMDVTGLDLRDAREAIEEAPILLSQSLTKDAAERFQKQLEAAGGKASVRKVE